MPKSLKIALVVLAILFVGIPFLIFLFGMFFINSVKAQSTLKEKVAALKDFVLPTPIQTGYIDLEFQSKRAEMNLNKSFEYVPKMTFTKSGIVFTEGQTYKNGYFDDKKGGEFFADFKDANGVVVIVELLWSGKYYDKSEVHIMNMPDMRI